MANFNYLDFFKTPSGNDTKLFIKDVNNTVVWTLSPFKIKSSIIQNNNIRINFTNGDFILIDFNNVYESKYALTTLQSAINTLINKTPLNIEKDVELWVDNKIQNVTEEINNSGNLVAYNPPGYTYSIINTPSSFTILTGTYSYLSYVESIVSFDNSSGLYLQATAPTASINENFILEIGIANYTFDKFYGINIYCNENIYPEPTYVIVHNSDELYSATFSDSFRFSLYSDGYNIFYGVNGVTLCSTTYSSDSYYFFTAADNEIDLHVTGVQYYPTGKRGYADKYYCTSDSFITIPPINAAVVLQTQPELAWTNGQWIRIANQKDTFYTIGDYFEDDAAAIKFYAEVDSYDKETGELIVVNLKSSSIGATGSIWYINLAGEPGSGSDNSYFTSASFSRIATTHSLIMSDSHIYMDGGKSLRFTNYDPDSNSRRQLIRAWDLGYPINVDDNDDDDTRYERAQLSFNLEEPEKSSISLNSFDWTDENNSINYEYKFYNGEISTLINDSATGSVINETTLKGTTQFQQTTEVMNISFDEGGDVPTITYGFTQGSIWYHDSLGSDYIANFVNVPENIHRAITSTIIISQESEAAYLPVAVKINDNYCSVNWAGGVIPIAATFGYDIIGFSFINWDGTFNILAQISNYGSLLPLVKTIKGMLYGNVYGSLINFGADSSVSAAGFVMSSTNPEPTIDDNDNSTDNVSLIGVFSNSFSGSYYIRAYAQNSFGVAYGDVIQYTGPCFAKGTLVTLSDGSTKKIEDITLGDDLLVWNFDEAKFDSAKPVWIMKPVLSDSFKTIFSDGSELITAGTIGNRKTSHRIFNIEKGKFTYLISDEDTPLGTHTFNDKGEIVTLISKENNTSVEIYNIVTYGHLNMFCNSILTSVRLNNMYPVKDMQFVKDSREIIPYSKFESLTEDYYYGFRLGEQPLVEVSENFAETNSTPTLEELIHHMKTYYK